LCFLCEAATGEFCGGLRDLDLSYNDVTHANAAHLRDMLEHCTALTSLNLDANLATGIKAINLACGLLACTALNKLSLQAIHPMHAKLLSTAGVTAWPRIRIHVIWLGYFWQKRPTFCRKVAKETYKI